MKFKVKTQENGAQSLGEGIKDRLFKFDIKPDAEYYISIKENKPIRSLNANRYYWGVVLKVLALEFGYTADEMHEVCKQEFNRTVIYLEPMKNGMQRTHIIGQSTTGLDTGQFSRYIEQIRGWAASEFSINIPDADSITDEIYEQISERYDKRYF